MAKAFISYASENSDCAVAIAKGLEAAGCATWYYERDSLPGRPYVDSIVDALDPASCVVLIVSRHSMHSWQVDLEVFRAFKKGKPIYPVLIGLTQADLDTANIRWTTMLRDTTPLAVEPGEWNTIVPRLLPSLAALPDSEPASGTARPTSTPPQRGADTRVGIYLSWEEAAVGCAKSVTTHRGTTEIRIPPGTADGAEFRQAGGGKDGAYGGPPGDLIVCVTVAPRPVRGDDIRVSVSIDWDDAGAGCVRKVDAGDRFLDIPILPGTRDGDEVRRRGMGKLGSHGGVAGDLVVCVTVRPPAVRGRDVHASLSIGWNEAWVGCQRPVQVGDRTVDVTIPEGTENGAEIRVPEMGEPGSEGGPAGDLLVRVNVAPPPVRGDNIVIPVTLAWTEARLGCVKPVLIGEKSHNIRFGPGTHDGAQVVQPGKGKPGSLGGPPGDLILRVMVGPRPERGEDVRAGVIIRWDEAQTGCVKRVLVDGTEHVVRVPPRTKSGSEIDIPGKGAPGSNDGPAGNLVVRVSVAEPPPARISPILALTILCLAAIVVAGALLFGPGLMTRFRPAGTDAGKRHTSAVPSVTTVHRTRPSGEEPAGPSPQTVRERSPAPRPAATAQARRPSPPRHGTLNISSENVETSIQVHVEGPGKSEVRTIESMGSESLDLPPGRYHVTVSAAGYRTLERDITVRPDATETLQPTLEGPFGSVEITVTGPDAGEVHVFIDGESKEIARNGAVLDLPPGRHTLTVVGSAQREEFDLEAGERKPLTIEMPKPAPAPAPTAQPQPTPEQAAPLPG